MKNMTNKQAQQTQTEGNKLKRVHCKYKLDTLHFG